MYSKFDNEEFEGYEKTNPSFKDTLIYREVKKSMMSSLCVGILYI